MADNKLTPEDKLLNIIENPGQGKGNRFNVIKKKSGTAGLGDIKSKIQAFWKEKKYLKLLNLKTINRIVLISCVVFAVVLVIDFNYQKVRASKSLADIQQSTINSDRWVKEGKLFTIDFEESMRDAQVRNIFSFEAPKKESRKTTKPETEPEEDFSQYMNDLTLVGIIWSETNPQAMVEDVKKEKTYLLGKGDSIEVFMVKEVKADTVVLEKDDKEWVLR
ncbi:MAG: hypothetical protein GY853_06515 [PVC group bacterium]|nr:hypothetical protein [PVC group bacterium]